MYVYVSALCSAWVCMCSVCVRLYGCFASDAVIPFSHLSVKGLRTRVLAGTYTEVNPEKEASCAGLIQYCLYGLLLDSGTCSWLDLLAAHNAQDISRERVTRSLCSMPSRSRLSLRT